MNNNLDKHPDIYGAKVDDKGLLVMEGYAHENNFVVLSDIKVQYCQRDDLKSDDFQEINVGLGNNGAGNYFYIETKRWAFDNPKELIALIEDFSKRFTDECN